MKLYAKRAAAGIVILWTLLVFFASNSPDEVAARTTGWLSLPIIRSIPGTVIALAAHPTTLAATFFVLGCWLGIAIHKRLMRTAQGDPWKRMGTEVTLMGYAIDNMSAIVPDNAVLGRLNLLLGKLRANGFDVPPGPNIDPEQMSRYLHHVGAYLSDGNVEGAKATAKWLSIPRVAQSVF